jgi:hypothetical protein
MFTHSSRFATSKVLRALHGAGVAGAALLLGACAGMHDIPPGTPLADVQARYGTPTIACPAPDGTRHLVWSTQPMGQYAWATTVTPDDRVGPVEQILTDASFSQVKTGEWNREQLRCAFGPPAEISVVGLPGARSLIWSYRYRQAGAWNSLMHFYLSDDGRVIRMHPGPDPMFDPPEMVFR